MASSEAFDGKKVKRYSFADALRAEVHMHIADMVDLYDQDGKTMMQATCEEMHVRYDPGAEVDGQYPYGKQRALYQRWGELRRREDADYWVSRLVLKLNRENPDVAIITDVRHWNEFLLCDQTIKVECPEMIISEAEHISEMELAHAPWGQVVRAEKGNLTKLRKDGLEAVLKAVERGREKSIS